MTAVDGGFSDWSEFSPCSATCGNGFQERERACNNPVPENGGKNCSDLGELTERRVCSVMECPGQLTIVNDNNNTIITVLRGLYRQILAKV